TSDIRCSSSKDVDEEPASELRLEPRALRRHQEALVAHREELSDLRRIQMERGREAALVDALLELADAADAAHEIHVLVAPRVRDAEDRAEDLVLTDRAIERTNRVLRVVGARAHLRFVPALADVDGQRPRS